MSNEIPEQDKAKVLALIRLLATIVPHLDAIDEKLQRLRGEYPAVRAEAMAALTFAVKADELIDEACTILLAKRDELLRIPNQDICDEPMVEQLRLLSTSTPEAARRVLPSWLSDLVSLGQEATSHAQKHLDEALRLLDRIGDRASKTTSVAGPEHPDDGIDVWDHPSMPPNEFLYRVPKPSSKT